MRWMRAVACFVSGLLVVACGATSREGGPDGGAGGSPSTAAENEAIGFWEGSDENAPDYRLEYDPSCLGLEYAKLADGTFVAHSRTPWPGRREAALHLRDGFVILRVAERGLAKQTFPAECFRSMFSPPPTCAELAAGMNPIRGTLSVPRMVECVSREAGGCDCTFDIEDARGFAGEWAASSEEISVDASNPEEKATIRIEGGVLRLYPDHEWRSPGLSRIAFERSRCDDGKKGYWEEGVDCGFACGNDCN